MADHSELAKMLGYTFRNESLLRLALKHPSVTHEDKGELYNNQRLEFLGDAVLQLALTQELYDKHPQEEEGALTKARAQMVNRRALANQAEHLNLGIYLRMSHGEELSGGRQRTSSLADAFEAIIGAVFVDGGYEEARRFVLHQFEGLLSKVSIITNQDNPKGELQERLQATSPCPPTYELVSVSGPDHDRMFVCRVHHLGVELGRGSGRSKKEAESQAALAALIGMDHP